jgi:putative transposase
VRAHRPAPGCIHHSTCGSQYLTRSYRELLRQYGLVPSVGEVANRAPLATSSANSPASRQIVEIQEYEIWKDVIDRPREFIQTLYSHERVDGIVGWQVVVEPAYSAATAN